MSRKYENFFEELKNTTPYLKVATHGGAGSGKTWTLALIIVGLYKRIGSKKPIVIQDTEWASKFLKPLFDRNDIPVLVKHSKTLSDLGATMDYCNAGNADICLIDSMTHIYEAFLETYKREGKRGRRYIAKNDWGIIKPIWWREFRDRFLEGQYHCLFTGREGYTWEEQTDADGEIHLIKTGVRMKAEGDTAYEPDLLFRMERFERILEDNDEKEIWHEATILKARGDALKVVTIKNPDYKSFEPFIEYLFSDVSQRQETTSYDDASLVDMGEMSAESERDKKVWLERNTALLDKVAYGTSKDARALRVALMELAYMGESSESALARMSTDQLMDANDRLILRVKMIGQVERGEAVCYPVPKAVSAARIKYLETENLGEADTAKLETYIKHMADKVRAEKQKGAA